MKKPVLYILLVAVAMPLFSQHLFTERSANRGEILRAYVYPPEGIIRSTFSLVNSEGRTVVSGGGFTVDEEGQEIITSLLGLPSDLEPGRYTLKVFCETETGSHQFAKPFFVTERIYNEMDIPLNEAMTDLRTSDDPQKAEQSRQLWVILSSFDGEAEYYGERMERPLGEYIESASFGDRRRYLYSDGSTSFTLHTGTDMAAPVGLPVLASGGGKVVLAEFRILTGNTVVIEHLPGVYSLYYHMNSLSTEVGMVLSKGMEIGKVGRTGLVTGPHLHWELRVSGIPVDPLKYIDVPLIDKDQILNIISSIH